MQILTTIAEMQAARQQWGEGGGLVPTMGALHAGHLSLVQAAKAQCRWVAVSIFVNPLQFGPGEDLARYPRTFDADCARLAEAGVEVLFAPSPEEMYGGRSGTFVEAGAIGNRLDGALRPGHFRGVCTVVAKLFHLVEPAAAFFGQKDAAQVAVLKAMVRDLDFNVQLVVCPTIREADGLAMSSRNVYLSAEDRLAGAGIYRALQSVQQAAAGCERAALTAGLAGLAIEYAEFVDPDTLLPVDDLHGALVAVAIKLGSTRLIDNVILGGLPKCEPARC